MGDAPAGAVRLRLVCFELHGQELAFPIAHVRETLSIQPITRVPLTPPCLAGVFSLRGEIVPAVDLGILFGLTTTNVTDGLVASWLDAYETRDTTRIAALERSIGEWTTAEVGRAGMALALGAYIPQPAA